MEQILKPLLPASKFISRLLFLAYLPACVSIPTKEYGIEEQYKGFIPAKIAVLPCQFWPQAARYKGQRPSSKKLVKASSLCHEFNKEVIKGFSDQPFMNGYTPNAIAKMVSPSKASSDLSKLQEKLAAFTFEGLKYWRHQPSLCDKCINVPSTYEHSFIKNQEWRHWLHEFSRQTQYSDALLMPFILFQNQQKRNDRGLLISERSAQIALVLIDTNNGKIIWSQQKEATANNQNLPKNAEHGFPEFPKWAVIYKRLFTKDLWTDFPGKQW